MRLRNIPRAESVLEACKEVVKNPESLCGHWNQEFQNERPCTSRSVWGKGQFLLTSQPKTHRSTTSASNAIPASYYVPLRNSRNWKPKEKFLPTSGFICMDANDLPTVFAPAEVSRIYLNFSDPWPKARHARRRLTSNEFFKLYDKVLTADGTVEFKTDNRPLFDFSVEELKTSELFVLDQLSYDLHNDSKMNQGNIMTEYEAKFSSMGNPICKLIAKRR